MKKIFITGGAGYVGSVLTPYLINKGHEITVLDLMLYGDTLKKDKNLNIIKGDIRNTELLKKAIKGNEEVSEEGQTSGTEEEVQRHFNKGNTSCET